MVKSYLEKINTQLDTNLTEMLNEEDCAALILMLEEPLIRICFETELRNNLLSLAKKNRSPTIRSRTGSGTEHPSLKEGSPRKGSLIEIFTNAFLNNDSDKKPQSGSFTERKTGTIVNTDSREHISSKVFITRKKTNLGISGNTDNASPQRSGSFDSPPHKAVSCIEKQISILVTTESEKSSPLADPIRKTRTPAIESGDGEKVS